MTPAMTRCLLDARHGLARIRAGWVPTVPGGGIRGGPDVFRAQTVTALVDRGLMRVSLDRATLTSLGRRRAEELARDNGPAHPSPTASTTAGSAFS